ncbi:HSF-type DNA-binding protein [Nitzschia inconspicua]|uniref:HSF-type DNA-binding protein n=1 Tax=Nitzschia inconspicua TaxID=303405 RepID=A0A9K3KRQ9_9STRA|nr:HSF-type DNA-binding protein [Nitzschia inconspicua]
MASLYSQTQPTEHLQLSWMNLLPEDDTTMNLSSQHTRDSCNDPPIKLLSETTSTGIPAFPWKLHDVLEDAERKGFTSIVSWTMGGRAFKVHNQKEFEAQILSRYFNQTQYKSFQRQLNIYNFVRLTIGEAKGSYTHDLLVRGKPDICRFMVRTKIKRKGSKSMSNSSERLNELIKQQNHQRMLANAPKQTRSLDRIDSLMMARTGMMVAQPENGCHNQIFGLQQQQRNHQQQQPSQLQPQLAQLQQMAQQSSSFLNMDQDAFSSSNQSAAALQRTFIPNQVIVPEHLHSNHSSYSSTSSMMINSKNDNGDHNFSTGSVPKFNMDMQPTETAFRRLSLKMFQDLSRELSSSSNHPNDTVITPSSHDDLMMTNNDPNDMNEDDLDHLFDDDIESIGEPVALEEASPYIRQQTIPPAMADQLLHNIILLQQQQQQR